MRRIAATAVTLCSLAALPGLGAAAPTITEFSAGITAGGQPYDIAAGADGNLWFTENGLIGRIGTITPAGVVTEFSSGLTVGGGPLGIAATSGGDLWFTENALLGSVGRATALGAITRFTSGLTTGRALRHITEGADGNLWATESADPGAIVRITPSGTITEFTSGLQNNNAPSGITAGPDGKVWFTESGPPARIGRISAAGTITEYGADGDLTTTSAPEEIVAGPDGNLWFTQANGIGRITRAGTITEFTAGITPGSRPSGIAAGPDGNLWFTETASPGRIGRITTDGVVTEFTTGLSTGAAPLGIVAGPDGAMWFTERLGSRIGRITVGPGVTVGVAGQVSREAATVTADVTPNGQASTVSIEYGPTTAYGSSTTAVAVGSGLSPQTVSIALSGLSAGTTYHFRTVATNASSITYGRDGILTTVAPPVVPAPPPASPAPAPPAEDAVPVPGRTVVAGPASGTILVRRPGSGAFVEIETSAPLPVGSVIDATKGRIVVSSAVGTDGRTQSATFWGGVFQVRQSQAADGFVDLHMRGPAPVCPRPGATTPAKTANAVAPRPVSRGLWGKDSGGRYRTHGRNSVATVRGTTWMTRETCAGTLTRVLDGAVSVRDVRRHRNVLVLAGGSYLARARR